MLRLLLLTALLAQTAAAQADGLFRYAFFGDDWTVTLDEPIGVLPGRRADGSVVQVKPGQYRLAFVTPFSTGPLPVRVTLHTDREGRVLSMRFDYHPDVDFDRERRAYEETLGAPSRSAPDLAVWEDEATRFTLRRGERGSPSVLRSLR